MNGVLFMSNNGNSLFLPANEDFISLVTSYIIGKGSDPACKDCLYWSSSLDTDSLNSAWRLHFGSDSYDVNSDYRCFGLSVRVVHSRQN